MKTAPDNPGHAELPSLPTSNLFARENEMRHNNPLFVCSGASYVLYSTSTVSSLLLSLTDAADGSTVG